MAAPPKAYYPWWIIGPSTTRCNRRVRSGVPAPRPPLHFDAERQPIVGESEPVRERFGRFDPRHERQGAGRNVGRDGRRQAPTVITDRPIPEVRAGRGYLDAPLYQCLRDGNASVALRRDTGCGSE